jgi:hypothetical protein
VIDEFSKLFSSTVASEIWTVDAAMEVAAATTTAVAAGLLA